MNHAKEPPEMNHLLEQLEAMLNRTYEDIHTGEFNSAEDGYRTAATICDRLGDICAEQQQKGIH